MQPFGHNIRGPKIEWGSAPFGVGAGSPSNTKSPGQRPTSVPSYIHSNCIQLTLSHLYFRRRQVRCCRRDVVFRPIFSQQQCRHVRQTTASRHRSLPWLTSARCSPQSWRQRKRHDQPSKFNISLNQLTCNKAYAKPMNPAFRFSSR